MSTFVAKPSSSSPELVPPKSVHSPPHRNSAPWQYISTASPKDSGHPASIDGRNGEEQPQAGSPNRSSRRSRNGSAHGLADRSESTSAEAGFAATANPSERQTGTFADSCAPPGMSGHGITPVNDIQTDQPRHTPSSVDYEQKYAPDAYGAELTANARVWCVYNEEAHIVDTETVKGLNGTLDVLLVFAGLFSAVVTTFVVQSSQALKPDYVQITASLLSELTRMQRAIAIGVQVNDIPVSPLTIESPAHAASTDVWVNCLWLTSLSLSLLTALIAVMAKQWIHHFNSMSGRTPRDRAQVRQYRLISFERWKVASIVGLLPVLLSLALLVFFAGLVVYVAPMHSALFAVTLVYAGSVTAIYIVSVLLPVMITGCAYQNSMSHHMAYAARKLAQAYRLVFRSRRMPFDRAARSSFKRFYLFGPMWFEDISLATREAYAVRRQRNHLTVEALQWLCYSSSNTSATGIALQAAAGLPVDMDPENTSRFQKSHLERLVSLERRCWTSPSAAIDNADIIERLARTTLHIPKTDYAIWSWCSDCRRGFWKALYARRDQITSQPLRVMLCISRLLKIATFPHTNEERIQALNTLLEAPDFSSHDLELHRLVWRELERAVRTAIFMLEKVERMYDPYVLWAEYSRIAGSQEWESASPAPWDDAYSDVTCSLGFYVRSGKSGGRLLSDIDRLKNLLRAACESPPIEWDAELEERDDMGEGAPAVGSASMPQDDKCGTDGDSAADAAHGNAVPSEARGGIDHGNGNPGPAGASAKETDAEKRRKVIERWVYDVEDRRLARVQNRLRYL